MSLSYVNSLLKGYAVGEGIAFDGKCHDCGVSTRVVCGLTDTGVVVSGGGYWRIDESDYLKCEACFEKDSVLRNFRATEVYSRCCGYLRPVKQWNLGKRAEYGMRKEFVVDEVSETQRRGTQ